MTAAREGPGRAGLALLLLAAAVASSCRSDRRWQDLRQEPAAALTAPEVDRMLAERGFFDAHRNPRGSGVAHRYRLLDGGQVVADDATGLQWQRGGSPGRRTLEGARDYVSGLRRGALGGFSDWRLPTLEEAMSLTEPTRSDGGLHLDPIFGDETWLMWTADRESLVAPWVVYLDGGTCLVHVPMGGSAHVRAVRSQRER